MQENGKRNSYRRVYPNLFGKANPYHSDYIGGTVSLHDIFDHVSLFPPFKAMLYLYVSVAGELSAAL